MIAAVFLATGSVLLITAIVIFGFKLPLQGSFAHVADDNNLSRVYCKYRLDDKLVVDHAAESTLGAFIFMPPAIMLSGFAARVEICRIG